jgi:putative transposase
VIAGMLGRQAPKGETMLRDAAEDLLAVHQLPGGALEEDLVDQPAGVAEQGSEAAHRRRRVFPNPEALLRLGGAVLVEAHDEWQTTDRRYLAEATMALLVTPPPQKEWPRRNS